MAFRRPSTFAFAILFVLAASDAWAWNGRGHMVVAAIAWNHLTSATRDRAGQLLKLNPFYESWTESVPDAQKDQIAFVIGATWPDQIKQWHGNCPAQVQPNTGPLSSYTYCSDSDRPTHAGADANLGYTDRLEHKYWHFIDMPFSPDGTALTQPELPNAKTQVAAFEGTIGDSGASDELKSYDLVWLEHLVGDVHQPLHATSRFTQIFPKGDQGGNLVCTGTAMTTKQSGAKVCKKELHAFWDDLLGNQTQGASDAANAQAAIAIAKTIPLAAPSKINDTDLGNWIDDSFGLAKSTVYSKPVGKGQGPYNVENSATYKKKATSTARSQVEIAGERLAKLLNEKLH